MERITSQTSLSAIDIYRKSQEKIGQDLTTTHKGDVRIATVFDRFINKITDFFKIDSPTHRREQAKQAIREKFITESKFLGQAPSTAQTAFFEQSIDAIRDGKDTKTIYSTLGNLKFQTVIRHIETITDEGNDSTLKLIWKAIQEESKNGEKKTDINFAIAVANNASEWKKSLNVSENKAYRLAYNAEKLHSQRGIPAEHGKEILQLSGRLVNGHGMKENDALQYAIDLYEPLKKSGLPFSSVEKVTKYLDSKIPLLINYSEKTRISAALCYLQLQDAGYTGINPLEEIQARLKDLPILQHALPKGCTADQIHDGSHIRGHSELNLSDLNELDTKARSLTKYPLFDGSGVQVKLPGAYQLFENQFVKDVVRGFKYHLSNSGNTDASFISSEAIRRFNPASSNQANKESWAQDFIAYFGSEKIASTASRFLSQSSFGDVETSTGIKLKNNSDMAVKVSGNNDLSPMSYAINSTEINGKRKFTLNETRFVNAVKLTASQLSTDTPDNDLPMADFELDLIPNAGMNHPGSEHACTVKRECIREIEEDELAAGNTNCTTKRVTETWDIIIDQKTRMTKRSLIPTL